MKSEGQTGAIAPSLDTSCTNRTANNIELRVAPLRKQTHNELHIDAINFSLPLGLLEVRRELRAIHRVVALQVVYLKGKF
jgi:hypothetical protein